MKDSIITVFNVIKENGESNYVIACNSNINATLSTRLERVNPPDPNGAIKAQSWNFISILNEADTYYLRNDNDVYLRAVGNNVIGGNISTATKWELCDIEICDTTSDCIIKCYIRVKDDNAKYITKSGTSINLGTNTNAVTWDVQVQDRHPILDI